VVSASVALVTNAARVRAHSQESGWGTAAPRYCVSESLAPGLLRSH
jgi:hypothetical protein